MMKYIAMLLIGNRRGKHLVMFESCYIDSRNNAKQSWFVGFVIFYFEHNNKSCDTTDEKYTSFPALIEVMKSHKVADYDPCIPIVTINKPKKKQLLDDPECRIIDPKTSNLLLVAFKTCNFLFLRSSIDKLTLNKFGGSSGCRKLPCLVILYHKGIVKASDYD
ncbi:hypothetical protein BD770DRAFT_432578 [Pilaira anomala]|nr:hypothetical protein BD770DRAFT_432578 [Pilaira anomala]